MDHTNNKFALLIGINYINNEKNKLYGCHIDVDKYKDVLINNFNYDKNNIIMLKDDGIDINNYPTGENIVNKLFNMAELSKKININEVTIYYSGHGGNVNDIDGDEKNNQNVEIGIDDKDECILPYDYNTRGVITDDLINRILKEFNLNTKIICVFDCCHSGTCTDLPYSYLCKENNLNKIKTSDKIMRNKNIFALSGCSDVQTSIEISTNGKSNGGVLTNALIATLQINEYNCTVKELFDGINLEFNKLKQSGFNVTQNPILAFSSENCDKNTVVFNNSYSVVNKNNSSVSSSESKTKTNSDNLSKTVNDRFNINNDNNYGNLIMYGLITIAFFIIFGTIFF